MPDIAELMVDHGRASALPPARGGQATDVVVLGEARSGEWDRYVESHADGTIFHSIAWRNAVRIAFGHEAIYLAAVRDQRIVGVLPLFLVASRLAGRMVVSVPYGVGGGILARNNDTVARLFEAAKGIAAERACRAIDLRSRRAMVPDVPVVDRYVGFRRELPATAEDVLGWLPRKARAAARNGRNKFGLRCLTGDEHLATIWQLYSRSMRRLASLAYPLTFFEALIRQTPGRHVVSLVTWRGRPVAGLVTLLFGESVLPYFIGTTDEAKRCSAAHFIYLKCMEQGVADGFRVFDFGRTRRENRGSYEFKRLCGFAPEPLAYQIHTMPGHRTPNLSPDSPRFRPARRIWPHLPLRLTQTVGGILARHVTG